MLGLAVSLFSFASRSAETSAPVPLSLSSLRDQVRCRSDRRSEGADVQAWGFLVWVGKEGMKDGWSIAAAGSVTLREMWMSALEKE